MLLCNRLQRYTVTTAREAASAAVIALTINSIQSAGLLSYYCTLCSFLLTGTLLYSLYLFICVCAVPNNNARPSEVCTAQVICEAMCVLKSCIKVYVSLLLFNCGDFKAIKRDQNMPLEYGS